VRALTVQPGRAGSGAVRLVPDPEPAEGEVLVDPLADAARALPHDPSQIKTVVEVRP